MGAKTPGFVLVDDDDLEFIADIVEPTDEQVSMFLRAETRRFNSKNLMKDEKTKKKEHDEVDEDEEKLEEEALQNEKYAKRCADMEERRAARVS